MDDTWFERDLPVLDAAVKIYDETGRNTIKVSELAKATGFDRTVVMQAARALMSGDYFEQILGTWHTVLGVGAPTGAARRAVGAWPSGDVLTKRLVEALEAAADDASRPDEERGKLRQAARMIAGFGYQVAVGALGGAGGNLIS
ncbi:hypothetical protein [Mycolicibacterium peregrinum]|uniref:hypothetical protein n=1 Tax=Mycolicibacterium peregrinum TaxID=43304 RepID=UPI003AAC8EEB